MNVFFIIVALCAVLALSTKLIRDNSGVVDVSRGLNLQLVPVPNLLAALNQVTYRIEQLSGMIDTLVFNAAATTDAVRRASLMAQVKNLKMTRAFAVSNQRNLYLALAERPDETKKENPEVWQLLVDLGYIKVAAAPAPVA